MDVFVYPSRFATESGALITALSYGRAVVASDLPPFKEKQEALMTFSDVKDLTAKINQLLENKELREQQQEKAKEYAKKTAWSNVAKQHIELYDSLIQPKEQSE
jgi:glycosyltransferase involved in cell wall biosynthesis